MVSIVIVAHSAKLAEGVKELVNQMTRGKVPLATAGGIDDPANPFGTDALRVQQAIESVYSEDGVVVLMDLGSALLSAEMALDFLPEEQRANIHLCAAPLVEGAVAAAVQAAAGSSPEEVMAEAQGALAAKASQLGLPFEQPPPAPPGELEKAGAQEIELTIRNPLGLHARPAALFVSTAARFQAEITVRNLTRNTGPVSAKSINQVATLGVRQGHRIAVAARGPDAEAALSALAALVAENFGEPETIPRPSEPGISLPPSPVAGPTAPLTGLPASPGIAIGPAILFRYTSKRRESRAVQNPQAEWDRLRAALEEAKRQIRTLRDQAALQIGEYEASILDAHLLFLDDPALVEPARRRILEERVNAEVAWEEAVEQIASTYRNLDDPYMQARAADVADVGQRVLRILMGEAAEAPVITQRGVLIASDLAPSDTVQLDTSRVQAICTALGGTTSHSAILARGLGIPAVVGLGAAILRTPEGTTLIVDGLEGHVWVDPDEETQAVYEERRCRWLAEQEARRAAGMAPAITRDGHQVEVVANVRGLADARQALDYGAEGIGLLRTEFLYLRRQTAPSEEEQLSAYKAIAEVMGQRPVIIRTLDVGGDKPLPYLKVGPEANPFLGWRAIRLCLDQPEILKTQLRAILRASPGHQLKVMFPMIATVAEVRAAKAILEEAKEELRQAGIPFDPDLEVGIMVEIPAAVTMADQLAREVDFFSIGTNDLSQYIMAADRTNPQVADLADAFHPAVLRMVRDVVRVAHQAGIWVGLCGELAGDPLATPVLVGLGIDELSMNPHAIPAVKQAVRELTLELAQEIAADVLEAENATEARSRVREVV